MSKLTFGIFGEKEAVKFLKKNKYKIIETNFRTRLSEIDIIALNNKTLCFIEVKTRKSDAFGTPAQAVNFRKQQKIIMGANIYLQKYKFDGEVRFDIVEVYADEENKRIKQINLIKNAFDNSI